MAKTHKPIKSRKPYQPGEYAKLAEAIINGPLLPTPGRGFTVICLVDRANEPFIELYHAQVNTPTEAVKMLQNTADFDDRYEVFGVYEGILVDALPLDGEGCEGG